MHFPDSNEYRSPNDYVYSTTGSNKGDFALYFTFQHNTTTNDNMMIEFLWLANDANFDARQMCVNSVVALPIHLILDKQEGNYDLNFDSTFDTRQRRNQICYGFATTFESCQR